MEFVIAEPLAFFLCLKVYHAAPCFGVSAIRLLGYSHAGRHRTQQYVEHTGCCHCNYFGSGHHQDMVLFYGVWWSGLLFLGSDWHCNNVAIFTLIGTAIMWPFSL